MKKSVIHELKRIIHADAGESIAEVLVAMLVIEMALVMVVSMIVSAGRMISKSKVNYTRYYNERNTMELRKPETGAGVSTGVTHATIKNEDATINISKIGGNDPNVSNTSVTVRKWTVTNIDLNTGAADETPMFVIYEPKE